MTERRNVARTAISTVWFFCICTVAICGCTTPQNAPVGGDAKNGIGELSGGPQRDTQQSGASANHSGITVVFEFPESADLRPSSPIMHRQHRIGTVGAIEAAKSGNIRAELMLDADAAVPHSQLPYAFAQGSHDLSLPPVSFLSCRHLALLYGVDADELFVEFPYIDGEYSALGQVRERD